MEIVKLSHDGSPIRGHIKIGGSKSISNRVLILNALSIGVGNISNLSDSDDTSTLVRLLESGDEVLDAHHAGTTFRFMTAYLCLQEGSRMLTGSDRMKQRPIGPLVEALREIGAEIEYIEQEGYPPLKVSGSLVQKKDRLRIRSDISSQFISALCMIAPCLQNGLTIELEGELVSRPYLEMTIQLMQAYGVQVDQQENSLSIQPQQYEARDMTVESDWSSASYFYSIAAIADDVQISLEHFDQVSLQADNAIRGIGHKLGVACENKDNTLYVRSAMAHSGGIEHDFIKHPDIAQTIAVACAGTGVPIKYKGLKTLFIKETDRVAALQNELSKIGIGLTRIKDGEYEYAQDGDLKLNEPIFDTYQDHRMAMSFAPLALLSPIQIRNPKVVSKSYPNFWNDLKTLGFQVAFSEIPS